MPSPRKPRLTVLIMIFLALLIFIARQSKFFRRMSPEAIPYTSVNRDPQRLVYSKHARCRMNCRQIDESEVIDILEHGQINSAKSDPNADSDPRYALEGKTHDGQQVRIIYAMAPKKTVVVTVIDLGQEIDCSCP